MPRPRFRSAVLRCRDLETRLAPANLAITSLTMVDASAAPQSAPVTGQMIFLKANYSTSNMSSGQQFAIRFSVDGVLLNSAPITTQAGSGTFSSILGGWYAAPGTHTWSATLDINDTIFETNETDNAASVNVTTVAPSDLPQKFLRPIGYTLNQDWAVATYADVDPRPGVALDYNGGSVTTDGYVGISGRPYGFNRMDDGMPILAAADGVIMEIVDGNYDRNKAPNSDPGNYVRISHGNNWETKYEHLMRNSIPLQVGNSVKAGQVIGLLGSSGNSTAPNLQFTVTYRGCPVEIAYNPATYQTHPIPYAGTVPAFAFEAGVSNYDPMADVLEHPSPLSSFSTSQATTIYFWATFYNASSTDNLNWKWYRPDGTLAYDNSFTPTFSNFAYYWYSRPVSSFTSTPGNWQVAQYINGAEVKRSDFTVAAGAAVPAVKVTDPSDNIVLDDRATAFEIGSTAQGGASVSKVFTIVNHGGAAATLSNFVLPAGFSFVSTPPTSVAADGVAFVTIRLDSAVAGTKFGTFRFDTNDPHVPRYNFPISGTVTGTPVTGTPIIGLGSPAALSYDPLDAARLLSPAATLSAPLSTSIASMTVEFSANGHVQDQLGVRNQGTAPGQIAVSGATVSYGGVNIGSFTGGSNLSPLVFTFNAAASPAAVQALMRNINFFNPQANPDTAPRFVRYLVVDNAARNSNQPVKNVTITDLHRALLVDNLPPDTVFHGGTVQHTGTFTDPTSAQWSATVDYGDGTGVQPLTVNPDKTFNLAHAYQVLAGTYVATISVINERNAVSTKTMDVTVLPPIQVSNSKVDNGTAQRSMVRSLTVTFSRSLTSVDAGAFSVARNGGSTVPATVVWNGAMTEANLTFPTPSLEDGRYVLTLDGSKFHDGTFANLDGNGDGLSGGNYTLNFHRFFGDFNGDGAVSNSDFNKFRQAFGQASLVFDFDGDGVVNAADFDQFRTRFGGALP